MSQEIMGGGGGNDKGTKIWDNFSNCLIVKRMPFNFIRDTKCGDLLENPPVWYPNYLSANNPNNQRPTDHFHCSCRRGIFILEIFYNTRKFLIELM